MSHKLWDGRFSEETDRVVEAFTSSIAIDRHLYKYDIDGSVAHCRTLARAGILTTEEADALVASLETVRREIEAGDFEYSDSLEDIHMHIENRLFAHVGDLARKLHTGRSRNDQVALDVRLYVKDQGGKIAGQLVDLCRAFVDMAEANLDVVLPGYTHLQRAQPVLFAHHMMAYFEMFFRDKGRFGDCLERVDEMPLGSAALAGTIYPLDRAYTASLLGFSRISENSMDAVSDRDFIMEFLSCASICMVHLSRFSEELVLWSTAEFAFVDLPDAFCTGSSIMPQKKNPDIPELVRGKAGRVFGNLINIQTIMKSLPLAYNRDMQEDKQPLMDTVDTLRACLEVYVRMLPNITVNREITGQAACRGYLNATDMADYLVENGMPFREAHGCVGKAVAYALGKGKELHELELEELRAFSGLISEDIYPALSVERVIERRKTYGGTAMENVTQAIARARNRLSENRDGS